MKKLAWKRFTAHFCLLVPSKTSQAQQFTRDGMFLSCDFTFCSSLRCLKNASDKYWMSEHQHNSFKWWRLLECLPPLCGNRGILAISDSPLWRKCAECKSNKCDFPWTCTRVLVFKHLKAVMQTLWIQWSTQSGPLQQLGCCVVDRKIREKKGRWEIYSALNYSLYCVHIWDGKRKSNSNKEHWQRFY